jgi:hypothetical protein
MPHPDVTPRSENGSVPDSPLPDEIALTLAEASKILLSLYDSRDALAGSTTGVPASDHLLADVEEAIRIVQRKLVPDFPELPWR